MHGEQQQTSDVNHSGLMADIFDVDGKRYLSHSWELQGHLVIVLMYSFDTCAFSIQKYPIWNLCTFFSTTFA